MSLRREIKTLLIKKDITQFALSKKLGMNYTRVNQFINGWFNFNEKDKKKFCRALKVDYAEFQKGVLKELDDVQK